MAEGASETRRGLSVERVGEDGRSVEENWLNAQVPRALQLAPRAIYSVKKRV